MGRGIHPHKQTSNMFQHVAKYSWHIFELCC
jgi:hypothetical protein